MKHGSDYNTYNSVRLNLKSENFFRNELKISIYLQVFILFNKHMKTNLRTKTIE